MQSVGLHQHAHCARRPISRVGGDAFICTVYLYGHMDVPHRGFPQPPSRLASSSIITGPHKYHIKLTHLASSSFVARLYVTRSATMSRSTSSTTEYCAKGMLSSPPPFSMIQPTGYFVNGNSACRGEMFYQRDNLPENPTPFHVIVQPCLSKSSSESSCSCCLNAVLIDFSLKKDCRTKSI